MRIMKPYWTPRSVVLSYTFSSYISSLNSGPESGLPCLILFSITIVSVRPNVVITLVSWLLFNLCIICQSFPLISLFHNRQKIALLQTLSFSCIDCIHHFHVIDFSGIYEFYFLCSWTILFCMLVVSVLSIIARSIDVYNF